MKISVLVGNPNPGSRTRRVAEAVAGAVAEVTGADRGEVFDLADLAASMFQWPCAELDRCTAEVAGSDLVVVASPTYKATYTGLLKAFLDRYPTDGLAGVVAIPVMTGGSPAHSMAPDAYLRPLLVELGASVPTRGLYVTMAQLSELDATVKTWTGANRAALLGAAAARCGGPVAGSGDAEARGKGDRWPTS
ncbi:NAD(P)H-dependent oxidoreductase [Phytohabitans sp. ZYX-F-186]|uniref:NAD(P)H-dependent oxidoreductase n=1 Tax=Phytohabitans maris TaxID=3071409 RepID=A0ABU0ZTK9_9ACTN|nr:NAD(P)H-dependent oxidoreductase [Phytohabitans sp. ZYX-F-186]MDQ7910378.1 NAD(P)H-dependent oxidoreductase [Phytohabitans sp. ZYX-F-186]